MNVFPLSFTLGFLCTAMLFALCFLSVIGTKTVFLYIKRFLPAKKIEIPPPEDKPKKKTAPRAPKSPQVVRSIEIDPSTVDRIYVKKSS
ncbi:MAG: hypothetical protein IKB30_00265 [Clostridia bacterium]|nr:hypothetical protein [Clostridia bacterium]MBR2448533.1 hypothetical protein [Clostridia bacterium]